MTDVEFHFDFGSPNSYLSHLILPSIEKRTGVEIRYVPVLLGGIFQATGNASPAVSLQGIKNKPEYQSLETQRFLARHQIENFRINPDFPVNTLQIMRGSIAALGLGCFEKYVDEIYRHMWSDPKKMDDPDVIRAALEESGLPAEAILEGAQDPSVKAKLISNTENSVARGVFGSPSFFVGKELYFGKDSLRDFEAEILKQSESH